MYTYIYIYTCIYVYIYIYTNTYVYIYICTYDMYTYIYIYTDMYIYIYLHTYISAYWLVVSIRGFCAQWSLIHFPQLSDPQNRPGTPYTRLKLPRRVPREDQREMRDSNNLHIYETWGKWWWFMVITDDLWWLMMINGWLIMVWMINAVGFFS